MTAAAEPAACAEPASISFAPSNGTLDRRRLWILFGLVATALLVSPLCWRFPLLDPDEGLHAAIAQEMVERGDYLTPRLLGKPFYDKPALYFWLQAASLRLLGMNEAAVRLPGLLCGLAGALTTALLASRLLGANAAPLAGLIHLSMVWPAALAQAPVHDLALVPLTNVALWTLWSARHARTTVRTGLWHVACGTALGLAVLTKGLLGPAIVGLAFGGYLLMTRTVRLPTLVWLVVSGTVAAAVAAPWYLAMHANHPGYLHYYFIERHFHGFAQTSQLHGDRPWWYYLPLLLAGGLPWTIHLPAACWRWWQGRRERSASERGAWWLAALWLVSGTLFLSVAGSKMPTYCLPLFPALALLITPVWQGYLDGSTLADARWYRGLIVTACALSPAVLPLSTALLSRKLAIEMTRADWAGSIAIGGSLVATIILWYAGRYWRSLVALACSTVAHFLFVLIVIMPQVSRSNSAVELADRLNRDGRVPPRLYVLDSNRPGSMIFYLDPALRARLLDDQVQFHAAWVVEYNPSMLPGSAIFLPERRADRIPEALPLHGLPYETVGRYRYYHAEAIAERASALRR